MAQSFVDGPEWHDVDVETGPLGGVSVVMGETVAVAGAGMGVAQASDSFHFRYLRVSGDVAFIVRLSDLFPLQPFVTGGIMIRSTLDPTSDHVSLLAHEPDGFSFVRRLAPSWTTLSMPTEQVLRPGAWLKLERRGTVVTAFVSGDGSQWSFAGSEPMNFGSDTYVGVVVASNQQGLMGAAFFDSIGVSPLDEDGLPAAGSEPPSNPEDKFSDATIPPPVTVNPGEASAPPAYGGGVQLVFSPSPDHLLAGGYVFTVTTPGPLPVAIVRQDLGKPPIVGGECAADISALFSTLPAGNYLGSVTAFNEYGSSTAEVIAFTK
jgi:regulation of enolase protein 1 (concanavalin A-like superfamily)